MGSKKKSLKGKRREFKDLVQEGIGQAAIGLESEFIFVLNEEQIDPRKIFKDPTDFIKTPLMHRVGSSYHIPNGGAVYFDNGVIEVATPLIEITRGSAARAGRSLWEAILFVRESLDEWEKLANKSTRLLAFSTHYNVSFQTETDSNNRTIEELALLLSYILPFPVMLLAANRRSTGVGVRPRVDRIEITADFTPSSSLMIATATLITAIVREVMAWESYSLEELKRRQLPYILDFKPMPHTSRKGWLARFCCYPHNPFTEDVKAKIWKTLNYDTNEEIRLNSLQEIAYSIFKYFWRPIARLSDPFTFRLISSIMQGRTPSLLELPDRPESYENVGRLCRWEAIFPEHLIERSPYERILINAVAGRRLWIDNMSYTPIGMKGWSRILFRRDIDKTKHIMAIDKLISHIEDWEKC
jgi:hypothetical protein